MSAGRQTRVPGYVWTLLIAMHTAALVWSLAGRHWLFPDSGRYLECAYNMDRHGEFYARPWPDMVPTGQAVQEYSIRTPGYPLVLLALRAYDPRYIPLVLLLQTIMSLLNVGLVLRWWAHWAKPQASKWCWAALGLVFPAQVIYANVLMSEILLQSLVLALAGSGVLFCRSPRLRYVVSGAAALSMAILVKPVFYPFAGGFGLLGGWLAWRFRQVKWAAVALVPVVITIGYMALNAQRTGYFHFSSISDINLLHYNAAGVIRRLSGPEAEANWVEGVVRAANGQATFAARQQYIQAQAGAVLQQHPVVYLRQHLQGMAAFFLDPGRFDISQFLQLPPLRGGGLLEQLRATGVFGLFTALGRLPLGLLFGLVLLAVGNVGRLLFAIRGFSRLKTAGPGGRWGRWWVAGLILYVALLTGPLGATRFLVPVWPLLLGLALCGLQQPVPVRESNRKDHHKPGRSQVPHAP